MRVRGLKHLLCHESLKTGDVAPHAGAWIETCRSDSSFDGFTVAPHAGAWIETNMEFVGKPETKGRTPCGCVD